MQQANNELISRVFSIVQSLEKCLEGSRRMVGDYASCVCPINTSLEEQSRVLSRMKKEASRIQYEYESRDWIETARSLAIFYGLNHMVRPEVMTTYVTLANGRPTTSLIEEVPVWH